jgi:uncharacterized damage-inducible protein DinB
LCAASLPAQAAHHSVKDDVVAALDGIEKKLVGLAEATPQDKLGWRPAEGIRSTSEVFMHVASANYFIAGMLGAAPPTGVDVRGLEKNVTKQADIVEQLKKSFAYARSAVEAVPEDGLAGTIKMFGQDATKRKAMITLVEHSSEHLGQSIAYARTNGITPPWSQ